MQYEWTQPVGGVKIVWAPIKFGVELDLTAAHRSENMRHLLEPSLLIARIQQYGTKPRCDLSDLREWDPLDVEAFTEEVALREAERRAALVAKKQGRGPMADLESAVEQMKLAAATFNSALGAVLSCARAASESPLAQTK